MAEVPETRYVAVGDADVAYQVVGDGPIDLLYFWGLGSHIDLMWDYPPMAEAFRRLASFSRLILFDRRGTGASDAVVRTAIPAWEDWTEDLGSVLDAVGSEEAAIFAESDAGPMAILFAAMHPERVSSLVLADTSARYLRDDDYPAGGTLEDVEGLVGLVRDLWGTAEFLAVLDTTQDVDFIRWGTRLVRASATPRTAAAQAGYLLRTMDVRRALPLIQAPTLLLHHSDNPVYSIEHARFLRDNIAGAKLVELPGAHYQLTPTDADLWVGEVAEFLTGERPTIDVDRVLTTVLFTDIVGSTGRAASLGDQRWRSLLDRHDRAVREQLRRFRGREIKTTGDGFFASFDGPARGIRCALAINQVTKELDIEVRLGLHTGECEVRGTDLSGLAVHIAARVGALAGSGEVLVTGTVKDLVAGSDIEFADRGLHALRGVPDEWRLLAVKD